MGALARGGAAGLVAVVGAAYYAGALDDHYPIRDWFVWVLLPIWGYVLLLAASIFAFGAAVLRWTLGPRRVPILEWVLFSLTVGLVAFIHGLYLLGATGQFAGWAAIALPVVMLIASAPTLAATWRELDGAFRERPPRPLAQRLAIVAVTAWGVLCVAFLYLEALHPSSINFDAAWYHIPTAQDYARLGRIVPFRGEDHRAMPHLTSLVQTWALLVPGLDTPERWLLILHLEFAVVVGRIVGLAALVTFLLDDRELPAAWVAFFLFPSIFVYDQNIGGSADHYIGFFAAPIFIATARSVVRFEVRYCALAGLALGGAMLTKYQAIYLVAACTLVWSGAWLWHSVRLLVTRFRPALGWRGPDLRRVLLAPVVIVAAVAAVSGPHFVKNVVFYGNPVYPYLQRVFPASEPAHERRSQISAGVEGEFKPQGKGLARQRWIARRIMQYPVVTGNRSLTQHRPYMGALFILLLPLCLVVRRPTRPLLGAAVALAAFYVWAATAANDRYLLSFLTIPMGVAAALMVRAWQLGWLARAGIIAAVGLEFLWGADAAFVDGAKRLDAGLALFEKGRAGKVGEARLGGAGSGRAITAATPPDARILARNYRSLLGLDRLVYSDVETAQSAIVFAGMKNANDLYAACAREGITHLLYPEGQRRSHSWNAMLLFAELARHGQNRQKVGGVVVVEMPDEPPPAIVPYLVLMAGSGDYGDGLYPIELLDIVDQTPRKNRPERRPWSALEGRNADELVKRAHAVVVGRRALPSGANGRLEREFHRFERNGGFTIHLRELR